MKNESLIDITGINRETISSIYKQEEGRKMDPKTMTFMVNWMLLMAPLIKWWVKTLIPAK